MKRAYLILGIGLCLVALAIAAPDFSGTWVMNASKSDQMGGGGGGGGGARGGGGGGGGEMTIAQAGNEITVTTAGRGGPQETKYVLDGAEHTVTTARGDLKYKAVLSGEKLTISGTRTTQRGEMPMKEEYSLSADGKELTVASTMSMQGEERVMKRVYDKK